MFFRRSTVTLFSANLFTPRENTALKSQPITKASEGSDTPVIFFFFLYSDPLRTSQYTAAPHTVFSPHYISTPQYSNTSVYACRTLRVFRFTCKRKSRKMFWFASGDLTLCDPRGDKSGLPSGTSIKTIHFFSY